MKASRLLAAFACLLLAGAAMADDKDSSPSAADQAAILKALSPGLVRVEYTLQFDKGEPPAGGSYGYRGSWRQNEAQTIADERPLEEPGFLVAADRVLAPDSATHPRFIKSIAVRLGDELIPATIDATAIAQNGRFLKLEKPFKAAAALKFDAKKEGPYFNVFHYRQDGCWQTSIRGVTEAVTVSDDGRKAIPGLAFGLVVDKHGTPVGMCTTGDLPLDGGWKGDPMTWKTLSVQEEAAKIKALEDLSRKTILRVRLSFRSPRKNANPMARDTMDESEGASAQHHLAGIVIGANKVLVLAGMKPKLTARLEGISVFAADGKEIPAKFDCTLSDYGAFVVTTDSPLAGWAEMDAAAVTSHRDTFLQTVDLRIQGENRTDYFGHARITGFALGWKGHLFPYATGAESRMFVFDPAGKLIALPISHREKAGGEGSYHGDNPNLTATVYLKEVFADLAKNSDPSNAPLTEEQENRLAWLGVELQPLDRELARANKVSDLTNDGRTGALVAYVYPGSPADKAGVKMGDILLRLHVEGQPKPIDVTAEHHPFSQQPFPWDELDRVPEQYFDRIPRPWPPAENVFNRTLTDLGFGKKFQAEFFIDGKSALKAFTVEQSPVHYDTAPRFKSAPLGLTVNDLTYEVRRYFQKTADDPGVIVSRLEPGSKASVAGIKPYELITHVNDKPVKNVKEFEAALAGLSEIKFDVKRMTTGRVVKIKLDAAKSKPAATKPAE